MIRSVLYLCFSTDFQMGTAVQEVNLYLEAKEMILEQIAKPDEKMLRTSTHTKHSFPFSSHSDRWGTDYI